MQMYKPTTKLIESYLRKWDLLENYVLQENSLNKLFLEVYQKNIDMNDVLVKVCTLNEFYSTNIFSPFKVAKHIISLDIDERLKDNDLALVSDISRIEMDNNKIWNFYSFATKYCSHHKPDVYPIYDRYVDKLLVYYKKVDKFSSFTKMDLKNYQCYVSVINEFRLFYCLESFSIKEIDKFLWQFGKELFKKS